jgi:hypothetical protein
MQFKHQPKTHLCGTRYPLVSSALPWISSAFMPTNPKITMSTPSHWLPIKWTPLPKTRKNTFWGPQRTDFLAKKSQMVNLTAQIIRKAFSVPIQPQRGSIQIEKKITAQ